MSNPVPLGLLLLSLGTLSVRAMAQDFVNGGLLNDLATAAALVQTPQTGVSAGQSSSSQPPDDHPNPLMDARDRVYYPGDTERFKPLVRKLIGNVLLDQKEIWTSPFHMHAKDAPWWIGFGGLTAALIATDHNTSKALENSKGQIALGNRLSKIGASYTLLPVVAGFYGFGVFT